MGFSIAFPMSNTSTWRMKLMVCNSKQKIVFAEVSSDFVDFWCNLLEKPLRDVLPKSSCSFTDSATSINALPNSLFVGNTKSFLTSQPKCSVCEANKHSNRQLQGVYGSQRQEITNPTVIQEGFSCGYCGYSMTSYKCASASCSRLNRKVCTNCNRCSYCNTDFIGINQNSNGIPQHIKENVKFILSDSLEIFENSSIKSIELINQAQVTNFADLSSVDLTITTQTMNSFIGVLFQNNSCVLNSVLAKEVFKNETKGRYQKH